MHRARSDLFGHNNLSAESVQTSPAPWWPVESGAAPQGIIMLNASLKTLVAASVVTLATIGMAHAAPALSWNLSRDLMLNTVGNNPDGVWTYMWSATPHQEATYQPLGSFTQPCNFGVGTFASTRCWRDANSNFEPDVYISDISQQILSFPAQAAVPMIHPGPTSAVIVRWTSPVAGTIKVQGRLSDIDPGCGNGVKWFIDKGNAILTSGTVVNTGAGEGKTFAQTTTVANGESIYFIVNRGANNDHICDTTELDVLITHQQ